MNEPNLRLDGILRKVKLANSNALVLEPLVGMYTCMIGCVDGSIFVMLNRV